MEMSWDRVSFFKSFQLLHRPWHCSPATTTSPLLMKAAQTWMWLRALLPDTGHRMYFLPARDLRSSLRGVGGSIEVSDCLPSTFKILSERLSFKQKVQSRAHPLHSHQSKRLLLPARQLWRSRLCLPLRFGWKCVIRVSAEWQHQFYTVELHSNTGRLIAPLCPPATFFAVDNFNFVWFYRCQNKSLLAPGLFFFFLLPLSVLSTTFNHCFLIQTSE